MKILVDVDRSQEYRGALAIISRLHFPNAELVLLHTEQRVLVPDTQPYLSEFSSSATPDFLNHEGVGLLLEASSNAGGYGLRGETLLEEGNASEQLIRLAAELDVDLVATGSRGVATETLFNQSPTSFVVAKGDVEPSGPLRFLFATDHSAYSNLVFEKFLAWNPQGASEVTIFTAMAPTDRLMAASFHRHGFEEESQAARTAYRQSAELVQRLTERGFNANARIWTGHVPHAIDVAVKESQSDLLVIGAQGHGFIDRLFAGSVASAVLAHASYPVLVIRP